MADLIENNGPQFKSTLSDAIKEHVGVYAPFQQLIDHVGNPIGGTNGLPVKGIVQSVTLHETATTANNGSVIEIRHFKTLTLEITGTATSHTTGKAEVWSFDVTGLETFRVRTSAIVGGNLIVKGKVIG